jgi:hypothetical protein
MKPTERTKSHVIAMYVTPARERGEKLLDVKVGRVQKELGWTNRTPSVFSTLSSKEFQQEAGLELIEKRGGPPSGGPSTTVQFVYRVLDTAGMAVSNRESTSSGAGLEALYGLCAETFQKLGGGEEFLRREREWGPDAWEKYGQKSHQKHEKEGGE